MFLQILPQNSRRQSPCCRCTLRSTLLDADAPLMKSAWCRIPVCSSKAFEFPVCSCNSLTDLQQNSHRTLIEKAPNLDPRRCPSDQLCLTQNPCIVFQISCMFLDMTYMFLTKHSNASRQSEKNPGCSCRYPVCPCKYPACSQQITYWLSLTNTSDPEISHESLLPQISIGISFR